MKIWMFIIATAAIIFCGYLMLAHKKWKIGAWGMCLSLAIFAGSSLNIGNLISVGDAFKYNQVTQQVSSLSNEVQNLKIQMVQSLVITQQISQTVNLVTEVRKEMADIKGLVTEFFSRANVKVITSSETNRLTFLDKSDGGHVTAIQLPHCPLEKSISAIAYSSGTGQMPLRPDAMKQVKNVIFVQWQSGPNNFRDQSYTFSYLINPDETNLYRKVTVKDSKYCLDDSLTVNVE